MAWGWCYLMEVVHRLFRPGVTPMVNRTSMRFNALSRVFDTSSAQAELGYAPEGDLESRLRQTLAGTADRTASTC